MAPRGAEICRRSCRAARLAPGLAHAAHAFHSLWTLIAAFHAHAPVQNRAGIVGPVKGCGECPQAVEGVGSMGEAE